MRLIRLIAAISCILLGAIVGALNTQPIALDLGMTTLRASLGLCVLVALLLGVVVGGGIISIAVVTPLRRRLRRSEGAARMPPRSET
ncbi:MAG: lipopolysaccharide assembly protein LapA domain-containing protein [Pseudomonadota bacterium]|nr:lipopolysaccharide assembly protein LapA domain-containing protein [Pseudomonadota bacterium]MDQ3160912.1 lipopolysaccharide assembly protein LapA domain-containing protein [Pseudomonadota bacterium]